MPSHSSVYCLQTDVFFIHAFFGKALSSPNSHTTHHHKSHQGKQLRPANLDGLEGSSGRVFAVWGDAPESQEATYSNIIPIRSTITTYYNHEVIFIVVVITAVVVVGSKFKSIFEESEHYHSIQAKLKSFDTRRPRRDAVPSRCKALVSGATLGRDCKRHCT